MMATCVCVDGSTEPYFFIYHKSYKTLCSIVFIFLNVSDIVAMLPLSAVAAPSPFNNPVMQLVSIPPFFCGKSSHSKVCGDVWGYFINFSFLFDKMNILYKISVRLVEQ